jgi:hypothetical protein
MEKLRALDFDLGFTKGRKMRTEHQALQTISPRDDSPASNLPAPDLSTYETIGHSLHQSSLVRLLITSSPSSSKLQMKANQPWQSLQKSRDVQQNASTSSSDFQMKTLQHRPTPTLFALPPKTSDESELDAFVTHSSCTEIARCATNPSRKVRMRSELSYRHEMCNKNPRQQSELRY